MLRNGDRLRIQRLLPHVMGQQVAVGRGEVAQADRRPEGIVRSRLHAAQWRHEKPPNANTRAEVSQQPTRQRE